MLREKRSDYADALIEKRAQAFKTVFCLGYDPWERWRRGDDESRWARRR